MKTRCKDDVVSDLKRAVRQKDEGYVISVGGSCWLAAVLVEKRLLRDCIRLLAEKDEVK